MTPTTPKIPPTPLEFLAAAWRRLRMMRTAIMLLILLGIGAAVGSLFPQRPIQPAQVDSWIESNPGWAPIAEKLGLFDVYGSWWFMAIYGLLLVSLIGCLVPRYRAWFKALRARPRALDELSTQQRYTSGTVATEPDVVLARAENLLKSKRFRLVRSERTVAGEKGHWREGGSLVFHTAFLVLLLGMSIGKWFGHEGQTAVVEGESFTETHLDYDTIKEGRFFREGHRGFTVTVDDFDVAWHANEVAKYFRTDVRIFEGDRFVKRARIEVNRPLEHRGVKLYQLSWGWAPHVKVTQRGKVLFDGATVFRPRGDAWRGVAKIPETSPQQTGLEMFFYTDPSLGPDNVPRNGKPQPVRPLLIVQMYQGDLGLDVPQNVFSLDMSKLSPAGTVAAVPLGQRIELANDVVLEFVGLKQYTVFQIATNPGAPVLLAAAIMILVGLIPALYSSRRRVWVRASEHNGVARLEIAGHALQRKAAFEEEFNTLVRDLDRDLHALQRAREHAGATTDG